MKASELELYERKADPKIRACLVCKTPFPSEWAGERICPDCKKSVNWRRG